jgi:hypothetical protein
MTPATYVREIVIPAAFRLLPEEMGTPEAAAMLMAIGYQESNFAARQQIGGGPARGFWMFEMGGVLAVITPRSIRIPLNAALEALRYPSGPQIPQTYYDAIRHNDVLAAVFARLLLWLHPDPLPTSTDTAVGWSQYERQWRPGKPRPDDWASSWSRAWQTS